MSQIDNSIDVIVVSGIIEHNEIVPLPEGYTSDQVKILVSINDLDGTGAGSGAYNDLTCEIDASRLVTIRGNKYNWVNGASNTEVTGVANYILVGVK